MDVQGAELMVLKGAQSILSRIGAIWLEVESVELYKGQPLKNVIELFMKKSGFVKLVDTVNDIAGDQLYVSRARLDSIDEAIGKNVSLSVIIPTYNRSSQVVKAVNSILNQTAKPASLEIIVIDDGSTDNTEQVLSKEKIKNLRYYKIDHTGNPSVVRNTGVKHARGDLVAFLDSDDSWLPNKLRDQLPFFELDSTTLVYGQGKIAAVNPVLGVS